MSQSPTGEKDQASPATNTEALAASQNTVDPMEVFDKLPAELAKLTAEYAPFLEFAALKESVDAKGSDSQKKIMDAMMSHKWQEMTDEWHEAEIAGNREVLKGLLMGGFHPADINKKINLPDSFGEPKELSPIEILLAAKEFIAADSLYKRGATLPPLTLSRETLSSYLSSLADDPEHLFIAYRMDPDVIHLRDENGETLLHHAARLGLTGGSGNTIVALEQIFQIVDAGCFSHKNNNEDTPLHLAASHSNEKVGSRVTLPMFIQAVINKLPSAQARKDYFSLQNKVGQAAFHLASQTICTARLIAVPSIAAFLEVPDIDIDMLSGSETTALYYSINHGFFDQAIILLDRGANPTLGKKERQPIDAVETLITEAGDLLASDEYTDAEKTVFMVKLGKLNIIKQRILDYSPKEDSKKAHRATSSFSFSSADTDTSTFFASSSSSDVAASSSLSPSTTSTSPTLEDGDSHLSTPHRAGT